MREDALTVHVPMAFLRRGGRKLIVAPDCTAVPAAPPRFNVDNVLVKALARGFRWRKLLDDRTYGTIKEIAAKERNDASYVADVPTSRKRPSAATSTTPWSRRPARAFRWREMLETARTRPS